jgi:[ribosomal protein S5]-alanine N-acetyltransferase
VTLEHPADELTDGVVRLRRWREGDVACVEQASADPRIPEGTSVPERFTLEAGLAFIRRQWRREEAGEGVSLAIAERAGDEARGLVWLPHRPQPGVVGLGYWVVPAARRRGLGTRAVRLAATWALRQPGIARVEAWVEPGNVASQRLLASAGFTREGMLRSFLAYAERRLDVVVFSRIAGDL